MYKTPPGGGGGSIASSRSKLGDPFDFLIGCLSTGISLLGGGEGVWFGRLTQGVQFGRGSQSGKKKIQIFKD